MYIVILNAVKNLKIPRIVINSQPIAQITTPYQGNPATPDDANAVVTYLHTDQLNTPRIGTDSNQVIVWRWDSDAFGLGTPNEDPDGNSQNITVDLRFPGQIASDGGVYYNYFRDYDPSTGRYIESDPIGLSGGLNTYGYVGGSPVVAIDVYGLTSLHFFPGLGILSVDPDDKYDPASTYYVPAKSGRVDCECDETERNKGPIPKGDYVGNINDLTNPGIVGDTVRNMIDDWGDWRMPLTPKKGTNTFDRDGFYLHGGQFPGSAGCIDIGGGMYGDSITDRVLNDLMNDSDGIIPLRVH